MMMDGGGDAKRVLHASRTTTLWQFDSELVSMVVMVVSGLMVTFLLLFTTFDG